MRSGSFWIIWPTALRLAWPAYTNEAIFFFRASTLVFFSSFPAFRQSGDALYYASYIAGKTFNPFVAYPIAAAYFVLATLALFAAWDLWATSSGTWGFNDDYTIGIDLPGGMAIEELVFFAVIPICGLLTLETVRRILRIWDTTSGSASERLSATARRTFADDGFRAVQRGLDPAATQGPTPPPAHAVPVSDAGGLRSSTGDGDATEVR